MSRRDELLAEIQDLKIKIAEHEGYIAELEEGYEVISDLQLKIKEKAADPEAAYDMGQGERFRGNLERDAEELRLEIAHHTTNMLDDTSKHLSELLEAIELIHESVEEWNREIEALNAELSMLSEFE